ncbi:DUF6817 domain-containing protein [Variovorax terrae]|uniref:DUF6817 domain-containing protein n=1 Tax=Variovorax terrae TaxID=2923278 RepID=A0A9X1VQN9_9BURK|nr:hypothetical protein [Variovorax terrae]MCJ0762041.1 hypothetical protein [Variovorax terrae]
MNSSLVQASAEQPLLDELRTHVPPAAWRLLEGSAAMHLAHSGRTLLLHLAGTWQLLRRWGNTQPICLAGLFHSIYGTNAFQRQSLPENRRPELQHAIGHGAEQLAWLFGAVDRPRALLEGLQLLRPGALIPQRIPLPARRGWPASHPLTITSHQLAALTEIECANLLEQGGSGNALRDLYCAGIDRPLLSAAAMAALRDRLSQQMRPPAPHAQDSQR